MFDKHYKNREGMPVIAQGDRWDCHGCSAKGKGKRAEVRMDAKTHAEHCREIHWEEAECRYRALLHRDNMGLAQLKSAVAQVNGRLKIDGDRASLTFKAPGPGGPQAATVRMNFRQNRNSTWSHVR